MTILTSGAEAFSSSFSEDDISYALNEVLCTGSESKLIDCPTAGSCEESRAIAEVSCGMYMCAQVHIMNSLSIQHACIQILIGAVLVTCVVSMVCAQILWEVMTVSALMDSL